MILEDKKTGGSWQPCVHIGSRSAGSTFSVWLLYFAVNAASDEVKVRLRRLAHSGDKIIAP